MLDSTNKILICFSTTGGGHKSAAIAIESALTELTATEQFSKNSFEVVLTDVIEKSSRINWLFVAMYNFLLRHNQKWIKYYSKFVEFIKPGDSKLGFLLAYRYAKKLLTEVDPVIVVSVHPMPNHILARMLKILKLKHRAKFIIVVTDPNKTLWGGWACPGADLTVVPNSLAFDSLVEMGIDSSKIVTIGMPVDPKFLQPPTLSRKQFLANLNLAQSHDVVTICLSGGRVGGGNVASIYEALLAVERQIQVIVICGNNQKLSEQIRHLSHKSMVLTTIVQQLADMSNAMNACDLLVTKAGGLTTYEAVARHLPMAIDMLTDPMPQEIGTAQNLIKAGLAQPIKQATDIVDIVENLKLDARKDALIPATNNLNRTDSVYDIAKLVLLNCDIQAVDNLIKS